MNIEISKEKLSLSQLIGYRTAVLDPMCFQVVVNENEPALDESEANADEDKRLVDKDTSQKRYVQIKKKKYIKNGISKTLIQIIDISQSILYEQVHAENQFLAITNATVSHELRNPL